MAGTDGDYLEPHSSGSDWFAPIDLNRCVSGCWGEERECWIEVRHCISFPSIGTPVWDRGTGSFSFDGTDYLVWVDEALLYWHPRCDAVPEWWFSFLYGRLGDDDVRI